MAEKDKKIVEEAKEVRGPKVSKGAKPFKDKKDVKVDTGIQVSVLTKENASLHEKISELKDKLNELSKENQELRSSNLALRIELSTAQENLAAVQKHLHDVEAKVVSLGMCLDDKTFEVEQLRNRSWWQRLFNKG